MEGLKKKYNRKTRLLPVGIMTAKHCAPKVLGALHKNPFFIFFFFFGHCDVDTEIPRIKSKLERNGLNVSHDGARRAARRTPGARGLMSTSQVPANALKGATEPSFAASEPGSFRPGGTFKRPKSKVRKATKLHVYTCCRLRAEARPCLKTGGRILDRELEDQVQVEAGLAAQW